MLQLQNPPNKPSGCGKRKRNRPQSRLRWQGTTGPYAGSCLKYAGHRSQVTWEHKRFTGAAEHQSHRSIQAPVLQHRQPGANATWAGFLVDVFTGPRKGVTPRRAHMKRAQTNLAESGRKLIAGSSQPDCSMPDSKPEALSGCMSAGVGPAVVLWWRAPARADAQQPRLQLLIQRPHQRGLERALDHLQCVHVQLSNSISKCFRPSKTGKPELFMFGVSEHTRASHRSCAWNASKEQGLAWPGMQSIAVPQVASVNHQQSDESLDGKGMEADPRRGACQQRARACMPMNKHEPSVAGFWFASAPGRGARRQRVRACALVTVLGLVLLGSGCKRTRGVAPASSAREPMRLPTMAASVRRTPSAEPAGPMPS